MRRRGLRQAIAIVVRVNESVPPLAPDGLDDTLIERVVSMMSRGRTLLGIAGAPGAGKSTLAAEVVARVGAEVGAGVGQVAVVVPMDGFHLHDDELARLGRSDRKGAPDTFDVGGYVAMLRRLREETDRTVYAPQFDRTRELSVAGAIAVRPEHRLVVSEGNYLLHDALGWSAARPLLDEVWFVEQDESTRVERLVERHVAHGKPLDLARRWTTSSDQANADLVAGTRDRADLVVRID